jgi:hypothetical protein
MSRKEFGPNQDAVVALLMRLESVTQVQAMLLAGISGDDPELHRARQAMLDAAHRGGRERELKQAQDEVRDWVNSWFTGGPQISGYGRDVSPGEAAVAAAPAVLDAIGALVVRDLLTPEQVEILTGPWNELGFDPGR